MSARAFAAWSAAALAIALTSSDPVYRALVVLAACNVLIAWRRHDARLRPLVLGVVFAGAVATLLTVAVSHTGVHVMLRVPTALPVIGGDITLEALVFGVTSALGIAAAVATVAPLAVALQPHDVVDAVPRHLARTGAALGTALNLVPAVARSAAEIRDAQRMRGWRPGRFREWPDVAVPVVLTALEHSLQLAEAMEARGFSSGARTHYALRRGTPGGSLAVALGVAGAALFIALRITGVAADWYPFPTVSLPPVDPLAVLCCCTLLGPLLVRRA